MTDSMVERVARALREEIVRQYRDNDRASCTAGSAFYQEHVSPVLLSRAAIEAMRDPTEAMAQAVRAMSTDTWSHVEIWQDMIDEALK